MLLQQWRILRYSEDREATICYASMVETTPDERRPLLPEAGQNNSDARLASLDRDQAAAQTRPVINDIDTHNRDGLPEARARLKYIVPAVGIGIFLVSADQTLVVSCYGKISDDLQALDKSSWISTVYFLSLTCFQPLYGKLSDIFGRKSCLLFAYSCFGLGCVFCGLARSMDELIVARAFAGIGGGGMTTVVSILMSDIVPLRERGTWQGIINIIFATGAGYATISLLYPLHPYLLRGGPASLCIVDMWTFETRILPSSWRRNDRLITLG